MRHAGVAFAAAMVGVWVIACVGSDPSPSGPQPDPGVPVGQYRGACTADNKCLQGLECTQGVCLYPGDGAPPVDGSSGSSSGSSSGAATVACPVTPGSSNAAIACGATAPCNDFCCFDETNASKCDADCATIAGREMKCDSKFNCNTGECCLALASALDATKCPSPVAYADVQIADCITEGCDPASNQYKMCRSDSECAAPAKCRNIEITTKGTKLQYAVCF